MTHSSMNLRCALNFAKKLLVLASASACVLACSSGAGNTEESGAAASEDFSLVLENAATVVIIPTYAELRELATKLHDCTVTLAKNPAEAQLAECQDAWVKARVPWEQSEGFLFGPVTDEGLDPAMDSWPVDHQQLDALTASDVDLSAGSITANLGGGMKGFHTIEYLLWGMDHERTAADLARAPREAEYLVALTEALSLDTQQLVDSWTGTEEVESFADKFAASGKKGGLYSSELDAVQELLGATIGICDEVAFGKIAEPFKARDPDLIESQYSYNSLYDFADNIRSIRNIYLGSRDGTVAKNSFSSVVRKYDLDLDEEVRSQVEQATDSILAIGDGGITFRDAILDPKKDATIEKAQTEIADLMDVLSGKVLPLFVR